MRQQGSQVDGDYGKSTDGFRTLKTSLEPSTMALGTEQTPTEHFFMCSAGPVVRFEPGEWRLTIDGPAAGTRVTLSLDDLAALPQVTVDSWLECAGNGRQLYELVGGYERPLQAGDTHWLTGAMAMARWTGVRLADVLALAEPTADLAFVGPTGCDLRNRGARTHPDEPAGRQGPPSRHRDRGRDER